jgi:hypothetical protein
MVEPTRFAQTDESGCKGFVKLRALFAPQDIECFLNGHTGSVGAMAGHGIKGITDADDACGDWHGFALEPTGVTPPIRTLVMQVNSISNQTREWMPCEHPESDVRMRFDDGVFLIGQTISFPQDRVWNTDFAQVMQKTAQLDPCHFIRG